VKVANVALGSTTAEHVIEIFNPTNLVFNIEVKTILPNSAPYHTPGRIELEFVHATSTATAWKASTSRLSPKKNDSDAATIKCLSSNICNVKIDSSEVQYREISTHKWDSDPSANPITIDINLI